MRADKHTLYDLFGARPDDDAEALKKAYHQAIKVNHPDVNPDDPEAAARTQRIMRAYEILKDAEKRAAHDRLLDIDFRRLSATSKRVILTQTVHKLASNLISVSVAAGVLLGAYAAHRQVAGASNAEMPAPAATPAAVGAAGERGSESLPAVQVAADRKDGPPTREDSRTTDVGTKPTDGPADVPEEATAAIRPAPPDTPGEAVAAVATPTAGVAPAGVPQQVGSEARSVPAAAPDPPVADVPTPDENDTIATVPTTAGEAVASVPVLPPPVIIPSLPKPASPPPADTTTPAATKSVPPAARARTDQRAAERFTASIRDAKFFRMEGLASYHAGDLATALAHLTTAIRLNPRYRQAYEDRAVVLDRMGRLDRAYADAMARRFSGY